jgi:hypothetical protein
MPGQSPVKPNPAATRLDADVVEKISKVFSLTSSSNDGEALTAVRTLNRSLAANGIDHHVLVSRMKSSWVTDEHKAKFQTKVDEAHACGRAEGRMEAEAEMYGVDGLRNEDGSFNWRVVALYLQREKSRLPPNNHKFVNGMAAKVPYGDEELTPPQLKYLQNLFLQLGGKIR